MRVLVVFVSVVVWMLMEKLSSAFRVSEFHQAKATNDDAALCGVTPPNKTLSNIAATVECVSHCSGSRGPCLAVNHWMASKLCQLFYYAPDKDVQPECVVYEVA